MSLYRKLTIVTSLAFTLLVVLMFAIQFTHTRDYLIKQQANHVANTLNALGLQLMPYLQSDDLASAQTTINALFDGGRYQSIKYVRQRDQTVLEREVTDLVEGVPGWFVGLELFPDMSGSRTLTDGWMQLGKLRIAPDVSGAYQHLWMLSVNIFSGLLVMALVVLSVLLLAMQKLFLPLRDLEQGANEIGEQHFNQLLPNPGIPELRGLVRAFNAMAQKLKGVFERQAAETERLRVAACLDPLTGLANRNAFLAELEHRFEEAVEGGLIVLAINHLNSINDTQGYQRRNAVLRLIADQLREAERHLAGALVARLGEHEFALIVTGYNADEFTLLLRDLDRSLGSALAGYRVEDSRMHALGAAYTECGHVGQLLARADAALQRARRNPGSSYHLSEPEGLAPIWGRIQWRDFVVRSLDNNQLKCQLQPVLGVDGEVCAVELLTYIEEQRREYRATQYMPFVEQYTLGPRYDRAVLELLIGHDLAFEFPIMINLSESSVGNLTFVDWLTERLSSSAALCRSIGFEIPGAALISQRDGVEILVRNFRRLGVNYGFDRLGRHLNQIRNLIELQPSYLKIDRSSLLRETSEDRDFLRALRLIAEDAAIQIIAVRVEDSAQVAELLARGIHRYQGYIAPPLAWSAGSPAVFIQESLRDRKHGLGIPV
ncbi:MAG: diguanylate cyclase (GGDEF)-like protein [Motiliproteus sp.]|jgi:diguanylate cyclase (GGDEF)-like protein